MAKKIETSASLARLKQLQEMVEKDQQSIERTEIIPIDSIQFNEDNIFNIDDSEDSIAELAENIKENGLLHNIVVTETAPKQYLLISGERRTKAMKYLGRDKIKATVRKNLSEFEVLKMLFFANSETREYSLEEKVQIIKGFTEKIKKYESTDKDATKKFGEYVSQAFNIGERQAYRLITITNELIEPLKQMLFDDVLDVTASAALAQLPENYQHQAYDIVQANIADQKFAVAQALDFAKRAKNIISKTNTSLAKHKTSRAYFSNRLAQAQAELSNSNCDGDKKLKLEKDVIKYNANLEQLDKDIEIETQKRDNEVDKVFNNTLSSIEKGSDKDDTGEIAQAKKIARKIQEIEAAIRKLNDMKPMKELNEMQTLLENYKNKLL